MSIDQMINADRRGLRRIWGGSGCMPPSVAGLFSEGERAALSVIAHRCCTLGGCWLSVGAIGEEAGVSPTTVHRGLRRAVAGGLIKIEDRTETGQTNVVTVRARAWLNWLKAGWWQAPGDFRRGGQGGQEGLGSL